MIARFALTLAAGLAIPWMRMPFVQDVEQEDPQEIARRAAEEAEERALEREREREANERDLFGRVRTKSGKSHPFLGAWQLVSLSAKGYPGPGMEPNGFLLVADDFLAFEMHVSWDPKVAGDLVDGFQTFMAEYSLIGGSTLRCRTLIGSYLEEKDDDLSWEPPGRGREFQLELKGGFLTLTWDQSDQMTFARRKPSGGAGENIFGRGEGVSSIRKGADIFGREPKKKAQEEAEGEGENDREGDDGR